MSKIFMASEKDHYRLAAELFQEYAKWLDIDLSFQNFEDELKILTTMYGLPQGCIFLYQEHDEIIATVAVRSFDDQTAEFKRMYVKPNNRTKGVGQTLLEAAIEFTKSVGYQRIVLDTLNTMHPAMNLYRKNGFVEIPAYYHNPISTAVYFQKLL